jgi:hypothetical protein
MNKFSSELGKTVELSPDSDEYKRISYLLNLNLNLPSVDINVKSISTIPSSFLGFAKNENENSVILESWVNKDSLEDNQAFETIKNHGSFEVTPDNPMKFSVGVLFPVGRPNENVEHTFILCKIKSKI